jgi:phosphate transport system protein
MPQHTDRIFETTLEQLRSAVLEMGGLVEDQIVQAVRSLIERNEELAQETIDRDHTVNRYDVEIDDLSLKLLALHQPAARDLRLITTALKITTDLERIGDLAGHIAERALELAREPPVKPYVDLPRMAEIARDMVHRSLDAFVREDADLALGVLPSDDAINYEWLSGHFSKTFLGRFVWVMLAKLTVLELATGFLSGAGIIYFLVAGSTVLIFWAATLGALTVIGLFFGQRVAKDYPGAAVLVPYFILLLALIWLTNPYAKA